MFRNRTSLFDEPAPDAPDGSGPPPVFDPIAFKAEIMGEFGKTMNNTLNGFSKTFKADIVKLVTPKPIDTPSDPPTSGDPKVDPALNSQLQKLQLQVTNLTEQNKERQTAFEHERSSRFETERQSAIKTALADIPFKDEASRSLFFKGIQGDIKRDEDGNLVADTSAGPITYSDYIKGQADLLPSLLLPKGGGGAGAGAGTKRIGGFNPNDMANLETGVFNKLTPEQQAAVSKAVFTAIPTS